MPVPFFDLRRQFTDVESDVTSAIQESVLSQQFIMGPAVADFEDAMSAETGAPHAIACASGTDALLLPLKALQPRPGDEVIVPAFTFFATAGAAWNAGFKPVFCDVDPETYNLTAETVERVITERTRAIIVVHLFGLMAPMEPILELARSHGITVIEDVAQSHGARYCDGRSTKVAGGGGDFGAFSFFPTKNLGAFGDAGLVTARDPELAEAVRKLRTHGGRRMYHHEFVGTNSRMDTIQAAVLLAKLPHMTRLLEHRRKNAAAYDHMLGGLEGIMLPRAPDHCFHTYNQYTIRCVDRDGLMEHLGSRKVGSKVYYPAPLHLQPCFQELGHGEGDFPHSERLCQEVLSLPIFPELTHEEIDEVCDAITSFFREG